MTYDQETLKVTWEELAADAGVALLLHTWATGVELDCQRVEGVRLWNKGGERWVTAGVVIDASGDADVAAHGRSHVRRRRSAGQGPVAVHAVQARQRRCRAGRIGPEGGAVGAHA